MTWIALSLACTLLTGLALGWLVFRPRGKALDLIVANRRFEHENNVLRVRCRRDQVEISNLLAIISRRRHVPSSRPPVQEGLS